MNTLLLTLYWVILVLSVLGIFIPTDTWAYGARVSGVAMIALFIIIGLQIFKVH